MYRSRCGLGQTAQVQSIAQAIAFAEGYPQAGASSAPVRNNNPCDIGGASQSYSSIDAGWNACYSQVEAILGDTSSYYSSDETIAQIAPTYTGNDNSSSWAAAVAQALGVSTDTPLSQVGGSAAGTSIDATTGLETAAPGDSSLSDVLGGSSGTDLSSSGVQLLDSSGNLTVWGWGAIALVVVGGIVWAVS